MRAASRWPRVDIVHSPSEVSKPKNSSPKKLARAFCYQRGGEKRHEPLPSPPGVGAVGTARRNGGVRAQARSHRHAPRGGSRDGRHLRHEHQLRGKEERGVRESSLTRSAADAHRAPSPHRASRLTARRRARGDDADTVGRPLQSRRRRAPHHPARRRNLGGCRAIRRLARRGRQHRRGHRDGARGARHGVRRSRRVARAHRRR